MPVRDVPYAGFPEDMEYKIKFNIAGVIFQVASKFPRIKFKGCEDIFPRYGAFIYKGGKKADIRIEVEVVDRFPALKGREVFSVHEPASGFERWRLLDSGDKYTYYCPMRERRVMARVSRSFSSVRAYVLTHEGECAWDVKDIIYDLMQVILINYFAYHKNGLILHAAGVKEKGRGLVFAGKSESGKSTSAWLWHRHSKAVILNDDRIILRRGSHGFMAHSGPWHGEFGHVKAAVSDRAPLAGLFVIEHAKKNFCVRLGRDEAFRRIYPQIFSVFWDRALIENVLFVCGQLIREAAIYRLGFIKNKTVVSFVRREVDKRDRL
jgi:hypothetical protein